MIETKAPALVNTRTDDAFRFLGIPTMMRSTLETTNGAYSLMEHWEMPVGFASPYHTHHDEDEAFYVLEGEMAFVCDGKWVQGGPGTFVFGPRELAHGFKVVGSKPARMLLLCSPGGFERFVLELGVSMDNMSAPDMAKLMETAAKYNIDIHGPLPDYFEGRSTVDASNVTELWIEAFNKRDWDAERAVLSPELRVHLSGQPGSLDLDGWTGFIQGFVQAFPDSKITIDSTITEGDRCASRWTLTGTHKGDFNGIPATGRQVRCEGIEFNAVVDGKVVEHWSQFDLVGMLGQLGALGQ